MKAPPVPFQDKQLHNTRAYTLILLLGGLFCLLSFWRGGFPGGAPPLSTVGGRLWLNALLSINCAAVIAVVILVMLSQRLSLRMVPCGLVVSLVAIVSAVVTAAVRCTSVIGDMTLAVILMYSLLLGGTLLGIKHFRLLLKRH